MVEKEMRSNMGCRLCKNYRNFKLNTLKILTYIRGYLCISMDIYYISWLRIKTTPVNFGLRIKETLVNPDSR